MRITVAPPAIPCGTAPQVPSHFLTTYLINDTIAVDAGSLGFLDDLPLQQRIKHVFISHTHIDHLASLPIFLENVVEGGRSEPVMVHGTAPVLETLQKDLFNDRLWPDFIALKRAGTPFVRLSMLTPGKTLDLEGLRITPVEVDHIVPTCGFIIEDSKAAVIISGDTGATDEIWERGNAVPNLKAVFLEATFPDSMGWLAEIAKHLTPASFAEQIRRLKRPIKVMAVHLKARFQEQVINELRALGVPDVHVAEYGVPLEF